VSEGDQICSHKDLKTPRKLIHNSPAELPNYPWIAIGHTFRITTHNYHLLH